MGEKLDTLGYVVLDNYEFSLLKKEIDHKETIMVIA